MWAATYWHIICYFRKKQRVEPDLPRLPQLSDPTKVAVEILANMSELGPGPATPSTFCQIYVPILLSLLPSPSQLPFSDLHLCLLYQLPSIATTATIAIFHRLISKWRSQRRNSCVVQRTCAPEEEQIAPLLCAEQPRMDATVRRAWIWRHEKSQQLPGGQRS